MNDRSAFRLTVFSAVYGLAEGIARPIAEESRSVVTPSWNNGAMIEYIKFR